MKKNLGILLIVCVIIATAADEIKIACVGNSITAGNSNYPTYLQKLLGSDYQVENEGVGGTTMLKNGDSPYWTKGRLSQALAFKPNIVTIKLGTNDTKPQNWDQHGDEFKDDYLSMIDTFKTLSTNPDVFLVIPVPVFKDAYGIRNSVLIEIIDIVKEIGTERGLPVIDANTPLLEFGNYFSDGVHPNTAGADTIAHVIYRGLMARTPIVAEETPALYRTSNRTQKTTLIIPFHTTRYLTQGRLFDPAGRVLSVNGGEFDNRATLPLIQSGLK